VQEVANRHGISDQRLYAWRKRFGALELADIRRSRQLKHENPKLKKPLNRLMWIDEYARNVSRSKWPDAFARRA
jgi:putative transposase